MSRQPDRAARVTEALRELAASQDLIDQAAAASAGVDATELRAIEMASREDGVTAGRLAQQLGLTTGAVTGLVDRMVQAGYLRRETDAGDRRRVIVRITPKTTAWERRTFGPLIAAWRRQLASLSSTDLERIAAFLELGARIGRTHAARLRR